ncbi:hypothetical protein COV82_06660 [Candidatus Peregrinibacteria bacterium CG11_big_fil_rev_8_21_14_0_20_46_8]|nr:MAG: hypothetical protein COV82_06660 [Candidatus Peregrinibacteria bacterium CG11_big_fil_rev_8_21_14_0_20_46_8]
MKNKVFALIFGIGIFAGILGGPVIARAANLSVLDTVAGFETLLKGSEYVPHDRVAFEIIQPNKHVQQIQAIAGPGGKISSVIDEAVTTRAGRYELYNVNNPDDRASFYVYAAETSAEVSTVQVMKNQRDVIVRIVDEFENPLPLHEVSLQSNRPDDRIEPHRAATDGNGIARFVVTLRQPGQAVLTATDETVGTTIAMRASLEVGGKSIGSLALAASGGDERVLVAQAATQVASFEIENLPATAQMNQTISFRIRAVDAFGDVVPGYRGTVRFRSTDPNVQVPEQYTFRDTDLGVKTFNLGLTFRTAGEQSLIVEDADDDTINGRRIVEVTGSGGNQDGGTIRITKPATGTYSVNTLEVAGQAEPHATVLIFDNGQQIGQVQATSNGRYSFQTSLLTDGEHLFQAQSNGARSAEVPVTIDSTPAQIEDVNLSDDFVVPGADVQLTIRSDTDLTAVQATVGDFITDLDPDPNNPGTYVGTLVAPGREGSYAINVILTDRIGNVSSALEAGTLRVDTSAGGAGAGDGNTIAFNVPSKVQGVSATPGPGSITLTWSPATAASGIKNYRIYYGTELQSLNQIATTRDQSTRWTIPGLLPGTRYYFQVLAVDANDNEGDNFSDVVVGIPLALTDGLNGAADSLQGTNGLLQNGGVVSGNGSNFALCEPGPCPQAGFPPATPNDGPGVVGMAVAALLGGGVWRRLKR